MFNCHNKEKKRDNMQQNKENHETLKIKLMSFDT